MRSRKPRRLTYANVMSTIAFVVAVSAGTAYAANEWTGANIVNESLTGADVRGKAATSTAAAVNGSLTTYDISGQAADPSKGTPFVDGSLTTDDVKDGSLSPADLPVNSIGSDRIADGTIQAVDLGQNSVDSFKVAQNSLTGLDIKNESLTGDDIIDNSIWGAKIEASSLGEVPSAVLGGMGRSARQTGPCNPSSDWFPNICVLVEMNLPATTRVLLIARVTTVGVSSAVGECAFWTNRAGKLTDSSIVVHSGKTYPLLTVTPPLDPGPIQFQVVCYETYNDYGGGGDIAYVDSQIAAVALSPS
ncbi:MAG TPA: hypothetical protein VNN79_18275 [Actinomycetota bacterium]|nr:hypothetical protein [Actinomycetota bacterium]